GFSVQHRVQRFLDRPAHHLAKVVSYPRLVDLDYLSHRLWFVVLVHSQLLSASLKGADVAVKCAKDLVRYRCVEADFDLVEGVTDTVSGYTGGKGDNPTYENHALRGFREAVRIEFDPAIVSYPELLDIFFHSVDPTDAD